MIRAKREKRKSGRDARRSSRDFLDELAAFKEFGERSRVDDRVMPGRLLPVPFVVNEFWTARQRQANALHEVSYRACFKPQLPRFFIERLTAPGDCVYDPFMGRGTTPLEAALLGRLPAGCDVNPLSRMLLEPRLTPPDPSAISERLDAIDLSWKGDLDDDLLAFYHPETLRDLYGLRRYFLERFDSGEADGIDGWIRMVAVNRLTGHSCGFFSVYTLPPNQAVSVVSQRKINATRNQVPPKRDLKQIIRKKSCMLLKDCDATFIAELRRVGKKAVLLTGDAASTLGLADGSVKLVVTSPPFLDVVDYKGDNWLRCWFSGIDPDEVRITTPRKIEDWASAMTGVFHELARVLARGGHVAFEVGEVRGGRIRLEETVLPCGCAAGLEPELVLVNDQEFTKTSHCWGVSNRSKGTNTNRVVVFRKP